MTGAQIFAQLVDMRDRSGKTIHERLALAQQLLRDRDWVRSPEGGGGDESKAIDRLEEDAFADLCGALSLPQLLEIIHHIPDVVVWKKHKFNLRKMHAEMTDKLRPKCQKSPPVTHVTGGDGASAAIPVNNEVARLRQENAQLRQHVEQLTVENRKLRKAIERIRRDVGELQTV